MMAKQDIKPVVEATIQDRVRRDDLGQVGLVMWLASASDLAPSWWSKSRDEYLRTFYKKVDMLGGAVYALTSRLTTIPFKIIPDNRSITSQQVQAEKFQRMLEFNSEWGKGWGTFYSKWITDLLTQDNGAFAEIIGEGDPIGPLIGMPLGVAVLDSWRCQRTSSAEFPVVYQDTNGKRYKLHHTRVAYDSLDPSPIAEMFDVGFCAVSKCLNVAQNLLDILIYKQEKLGSRPHRNIILTKGGLGAAEVKEAFALASETMDNQALSRYSKSVLIGSKDHPEAGLEMHDLAKLPDGFDYKEDMTLGMAAIALAFGVDARELWPMMGVGATRADALIQHLKSRMKGIGQLLAISERTFTQKILPPNLKLIFDYQDDAQDRQVAEIRKIRAERHEIDLRTLVVDERTVREQMLNANDISEDQFIELELGDGRLRDGTSVLTLFYDPEYFDILNMGIANPLDIENNDWELVKPILADKRDELWQALGILKDFRKRRLVRQGLAAVDTLEAEYEDVTNKQAMMELRSATEEEQEPTEPNETSEEPKEEETSEQPEAEVV